MLTGFSIKTTRDTLPQGLYDAETWGEMYEALMDLVQQDAVFLPFDSTEDALAKLSSASLDTLAREFEALFYDVTWEDSAKRAVLAAYLDTALPHGSADWLQTILRTIGSEYSFVIDNRTYTGDDAALYESMKESFDIEPNEFLVLLDVDTTTPEEFEYVGAHLAEVYAWRFKTLVLQISGTVGVGAAGTAMYSGGADIEYLYDTLTVCATMEYADWGIMTDEGETEYVAPRGTFDTSSMTLTLGGYGNSYIDTSSMTLQYGGGEQLYMVEDTTKYAYLRSSAYQSSNRTLAANTEYYLYAAGSDSSLAGDSGVTYTLTGAYTAADASVDITGASLAVSGSSLKLTWGSTAAAVCYITYTEA